MRGGRGSIYIDPCHAYHTAANPTPPGGVTSNRTAGYNKTYVNIYKKRDLKGSKNMRNTRYFIEIFLILKQSLNGIRVNTNNDDNKKN